LKELKWDTSTF